MRNAKLMGLVEEMVFTMEAINKSVEIKLKYWPESSPIEGQDIQWLKYIWECSDGKEVYVYEDKIPDNLRHTVIFQFLIERFLRLKTSEAMAIRWHMGGFDDSAKGGSFSVSLAYERYPIAVKLHLADLESTYLREKGTSSVVKK